MARILPSDTQMADGKRLLYEDIEALDGSDALGTVRVPVVKLLNGPDGVGESNVQVVAPGDDALNDWKKIAQGPFIPGHRVSDGTFKVGAGFAHTATFANASASAVTMSLFDDASGSTGAIEVVVVPANSTVHVALNAAFFNALRVTSTSWASVFASARFR